MKLAGHTLGTPQLAVPDALRLFAELGFDGAEVIWQDGYQSALPEKASGLAIDETRRLSRELGLEIACLTPYMTALNSLNPAERERDLNRFSDCIRAAAALECHFIRVYAGKYFPEDAPNRAAMWSALVASLRDLAAEALAGGVTLCVENHFGTMTVTAAEARELMLAVDSSSVGILYDQANLTFTHAEPAEQAISVQGNWIRHAHVKDLVFIDPDAPFVASAVANVTTAERTVRSRVVGDGILDWAFILERLRNAGYDGYLSLEYEYRWHPADLPAPLEGFARGAERVRALLAAGSRP